MAYHLEALIAVVGEFSTEPVSAEVQCARQLQLNFKVSAQHGPPCADWQSLRCFSWRAKEGREALESAATADDFKIEADSMKAWKSLLKQLEDTCKAAARELRAISTTFATAKRQEADRIAKQSAAAAKREAKAKQDANKRIGAGRSGAADKHTAQSARVPKELHCMLHFDQLPVVRRFQSLADLQACRDFSMCEPYLVKAVPKIAEIRSTAEDKFLKQLEFFEQYMESLVAKSVGR